MAYTPLGDANLDGLVNGTDFADLAANFGQGVSGATSAGDIAALDAFAMANGLPLPMYRSQDRSDSGSWA